MREVEFSIAGRNQRRGNIKPTPYVWEKSDKIYKIVCCGVLKEQMGQSHLKRRETIIQRLNTYRIQRSFHK